MAKRSRAERRNKRSRAERKQPRAPKVEVATIIFTHTFLRITPDGSRDWWWVRMPRADTSDEEARQQIPWHGPFRSEQEARADQRRVLVGPQSTTIEGGMWDPAWDKPQ